jgi:hypothetical protein
MLSDMMNPLGHTLEAQFHGAVNAITLRQLHAAGDYNALLEYALLLADSEASQRSQIKWLAAEAMQQSRGISQWHMDAAKDLLAGGS